MELFFCNAIDDTPVILGPDESWHLSKVLRLRVGDAVAVTDGHGGFGTGEIMDTNPKAALIRLKEVRQAYNQRPYSLHIAIAPTKNIDRLEWFLEKATEIGIAAISPIRCQRSERKDVRIDRLEKVVMAAVKQSLQAYLPQIHPMESLSKFLESNPAGQRFACITHQTPEDGLQFLARPGGRVVIVIGPEGDFTEDEINLLLQHGFRGCSLGPNRLRTETAGLAACHTIALINQVRTNA